MASDHTTLRVEGQDLFEDQLRARDTRSVRRASGLVLVGNSSIIGLRNGSGVEYCLVLSDVGVRAGVFC